jgi:hypothetical protein
MYWTLDILSDRDPSVREDRTDHWEDSIDEDSSPKLKFPIKIKEDPLKGETIAFEDPIIKDPKPRKKEIDRSCVVMEHKKNKTDKKKLF